MNATGSGVPSGRAFAVLAASSAVCLALLAANVCYGGNGDYAFLAWNLLLAAIPFWLALTIQRVDRLGAQWAIVPLSALCLLFLPNAPYMVTDFVHVGTDRAVPFWSDIVLFTAFAAMGLVLGWLSLRILLAVARERIGAMPARIAATTAVVASSFGIFLGRFEFLNSWDLLTRPGVVLRGALDGPVGHEAAFTIGFSLFLCAVFAGLEGLSRLRF
jgi:uncharacterized membrane protein